MIKYLRGHCIFIAVLPAFLFSCSDSQPKTVTAPVAPAVKATTVMAPFRFHKLIEVAPGHDFDIMSWGRGSNTAGALLILRSDSARKVYTTTTGDLDGDITDVFNSDMDTDGNPELLVQAKAKDTIDYTNIYAYEFNDKANKLDFPKLTSNQKKGYRGNDNFYMKEGKLIREFPIFDGNTSTAKPTGAKRVLEYNLRSNNLTAKDLSADTLKVAVKDVPIAEKPVEKKQEVKSSKKQTKKATKKRKEKPRKKRRHRR